MRRSVLVLLFALAALPALAAPVLPVLHSSRPTVSIRTGTEWSPDSWRLSPETRPDVYTVGVTSGRRVRVVFLTDTDSMTFDVAAGESQDFTIVHGPDSCWTRVTGVRMRPAAVFDAAYRTAHRGRIEVEVPEAYELVNIVIALTRTGLTDSTLVFHPSNYHREVLAWFAGQRLHPAVLAFDSVLASNRNAYSTLKMNGRALEFDRRGRLTRSPVYDRTGFPGEITNPLHPWLPLLQSFADEGRFREFYRQHAALYAEQCAYFRDSADVRGMLDWLAKRFPEVKPYDSFHVVFSPLVAYNQSSTWLESDGFRELQAHVNFPYPSDAWRWARRSPLSPAGLQVMRGAIVFTELNHGFINPTADRFPERASRAVADRAHWVDADRPPGYYGGVNTFNEYMNWALVPLYAADITTLAEADAVAMAVDRMMTRSRGFPRFEAFDAFLRERYRERPPGGTVSAMYPDILEWFGRDAAGDTRAAPER